MLKVLLAGLGVRGRHWAEVINRSERADLVAFADPSSVALARAVSEFGERPAFSSVAAALDALDRVDAMVLANPPGDREAIIRLACARRLPMLIEKPLALNLAEATTLVEIAESDAVSLMVGLNFRYLAVTKALMRLLAENAVGPPAFARFTYERWRDGRRPDLNDYPLAMEHPMLWEQSIHHFDLMRFVYGREPVQVQCQTWNPSWSMYAGDSNVSALIEFEGDLRVNYQGTWQGSWEAPGFEWRTDCADGIITQRDEFGALHFARRDEAALRSVPLPPHERWISETTALLAAFVDHVIDGAALQCSGRDHLMSLAMLEACIQSSASGNGVLIRDVLPAPGKL